MDGSYHSVKVRLLLFLLTSVLPLSWSCLRQEQPILSEGDILQDNHGEDQTTKKGYERDSEVSFNRDLYRSCHILLDLDFLDLHEPNSDTYEAVFIEDTATHKLFCSFAVQKTEQTRTLELKLESSYLHHRSSGNGRVHVQENFFEAYNPVISVLHRTNFSRGRLEMPKRSFRVQSDLCQHYGCFKAAHDSNFLHLPREGLSEGFNGMSENRCGRRPIRADSQIVGLLLLFTLCSFNHNLRKTSILVLITAQLILQIASAKDVPAPLSNTAIGNPPQFKKLNTNVTHTDSKNLPKANSTVKHDNQNSHNVDYDYPSFNTRSNLTEEDEPVNAEEYFEYSGDSPKEDKTVNEMMDEIERILKEDTEQEPPKSRRRPLVRSAGLTLTQILADCKNNFISFLRQSSYLWPNPFWPADANTHHIDYVTPMKKELGSNTLKDCRLTLIPDLTDLINRYPAGGDMDILNLCQNNDLESLRLCLTENNLSLSQYNAAVSQCIMFKNNSCREHLCGQTRVPVLAFESVGKSRELNNGFGYSADGSKEYVGGRVSSKFVRAYKRSDSQFESVIIGPGGVQGLDGFTVPRVCGCGVEEAERFTIVLKQHKDRVIANTFKNCVGKVFEMNSTEPEAVSQHKSSCKSKWGFMRQTFSWLEGKETYKVRVLYPFWKLGVFINIKRERDVPETKKTIEIYYYKRMNRFFRWESFIPNEKVDLSYLTRDECGCLANEVCKTQNKNVLRLGPAKSLDDRQTKVEDLKVFKSSQHPYHHIQLLMPQVLTEYGIYSGMHHLLSGGKRIKEAWQVVHSRAVVSKTHEKFRVHIGSDKNFKTGKYSSHLNLTRSGDYLQLRKTDLKSIQIRSHKGVHGIDVCLDQMADGSEVSARKLVRCNSGRDLVSEAMFWSSVSILSAILVWHLYYWIRCKCDVVYKLEMELSFRTWICPPNGANRTKMYSRMEKLTESGCYQGLDKIKYLYCCIDHHDTQIVKSRLTSFMIQLTLVLPLMYVLFFVILSPFYIILVVWTIITRVVLLGRRATGSYDDIRQILYGPYFIVWCLCCNRNTKTNCSFESRNAFKLGLSSAIMWTFITYIIISGYLFLPTLALAESGQSLTVAKSCSGESCKYEFTADGSLDFDKSSRHDWTLMDRDTKLAVGTIELKVLEAQYKHSLSLDFVNPSFVPHLTQIVCRNDDMNTNQGCWGRWWNQADNSETECDTWGVTKESFHPQTRLPDSAYWCRTFNHKGYWYGMFSSPSDGGEWSGVKFTPMWLKEGRTQWTSETSGVEGEVEVKITINGDKIVDRVDKINRYLDTMPLSEVNGDIRMTERRVDGSSLTGQDINCKFSDLKHFRSPECYMIRKSYEDANNFNIPDLPTAEGAITGHNRVNVKRNPGSADERGALITYRDHNEPDSNYYGQASRVGLFTGCDSHFRVLTEQKGKDVERCSTIEYKDKEKCEEAREKWLTVQTNRTSGQLTLSKCTSVKLDYRIDIELNAESDGAVIDTVDLKNLEFEFSGCYGSLRNVIIHLSSSTSENGLVIVSTSSDLVTCPSSINIEKGGSDLNCSSSVQKFEITMQTPDLKKKVVKTVNLEKACDSHTYDLFCDSCSNGESKHTEDTLSFKELLMFAAVATGSVILLVVIISVLNPINTIVGSLTKVTQRSRSSGLDDYERLPTSEADIFNKELPPHLTKKYL